MANGSKPPSTGLHSNRSLTRNLNRLWPGNIRELPGSNRLGCEYSAFRDGVNFHPAFGTLPVIEYGVNRVFLLSPARSAGKRAELIFNPRAGFDLARRLQRGKVAPISEIFTFLSGLYFRGKIAYARSFARPPRASPGVLVITTNRGLINAETPLTLEELAAFATVEIDHADPRYRGPLERDARKLAKRLGKSGDAVL